MTSDQISRTHERHTINTLMPSTKTFSTLRLIALYFLLMTLINIVHFIYFPVHVVLYNSFLDVVLAGLGVGALVWQYPSLRMALSSHELLLSLAVGFLASSLYAISVPTIIDRSLSIYILEKLAQRGGGIRRDALSDVFKNEYMPEYKLVDIRLTEQLNSGTITIKDGCVLLTPRGRNIVAFTRLYRAWLLPKNREIMGEFNDSLTDPFRNSTDDVSYRCGPHP